MKTLNLLIKIVVFVFFMNYGYSQNNINNCKVVNNELKGEYLGECYKGLADGKGTLVFADGQFMYKGYFKEGKMHGKGEMFIIENGKSSLIKKGVWKENVFCEDTNPYVVGKTINLDRYLVRKIGEGKRVNLNFYQNGTRNDVKNLSVFTNNGNRVTGSYIEGYENVEFPFKCDVTYLTGNKLNTTTYQVRFEIVINEPGDWEITLTN